MQKYAEERHQEVLTMIEALSEAASSEKASLVWKLLYSRESGNDFCAEKQALFRVLQQVAVSTKVSITSLMLDLF